MQQNCAPLRKAYSKSLKKLLSLKMLSSPYERQKIQKIKEEIKLKESRSIQKLQNQSIKAKASKKKYAQYLDQIITDHMKKQDLQIIHSKIQMKKNFKNLRIITNQSENPQSQRKQLFKNINKKKNLSNLSQSINVQNFPSFYQLPLILQNKRCKRSKTEVLKEDSRKEFDEISKQVDQKCERQQMIKLLRQYRLRTEQQKKVQKQLVKKISTDLKKFTKRYEVHVDDGNDQLA